MYPSLDTKVLKLDRPFTFDVMVPSLKNDPLFNSVKFTRYVLDYLWSPLDYECPT